MAEHGVRRVVTGVDEAGNSVFLSDEVVAVTGMSNAPAGTGVAKMWGADDTPEVPAAEVRFEYGTVFPSAPGFRYQVFHVMPDSVRAGLPALSPEELARDLDEKFPGLRDHMPEASGMHTTPTVDLGIVLEGEIVLELDNGAEKHLSRGDSYVMNGTRHAWHNRTDEVAVMAVVLIGANLTGH